MLFIKQKACVRHCEEERRSKPFNGYLVCFRQSLRNDGKTKFPFKS